MWTEFQTEKKNCQEINWLNHRNDNWDAGQNIKWFCLDWDAHTWHWCMAVIILIIDNSYLATLDWVHWTEAAAKAAKIVESRFSVNVRPRMDQQSSHNLLSWAKILTILTSWLWPAEQRVEESPWSVDTWQKNDKNTLISQQRSALVI